MKARGKKIRIIGRLPPSPCAPMPVAGTVGYVMKPRGASDTPPKGKALVEFREDFDCVSGGRTMMAEDEEHEDPIRLYIPIENIESAK